MQGREILAQTADSSISIVNSGRCNGSEADFIKQSAEPIVDASTWRLLYFYGTQQQQQQLSVCLPNIFVFCNRKI